MTLAFELVTPKSIGMLPRADVGTKFEEGWSRCPRVIDRKWFWHIRPRWPWPLIQCPQNI